LSLAERVALISGATGGMGRVVAATFAAAGARVALGGTNHDRLAALAADLGLADGTWVVAVGDVTTPDGARDQARAAVEAFGRIDILVHAVGGFAAGTAVADGGLDDTQSMIDRHLWSTVHLVQAVVPGMVERGWGRVLAATTSAAANAPARSGPYAAAKAAQETLLRSLAKEVGPAGVTVNVVSLRKVDVDHERETAPSPKNAAWTTPEEIAATFLHLCSDEAAAINGARIPLDGRT
jgi:NAD(P)-dependent dehydrogenase (short-subunit alcohol dehydrogenase family)